MESKPGERASAETELFLARVDIIMAEESLILDGLKLAVQRGEITEDEKHAWLNSYVQRKLTPIQHSGLGEEAPE